MEPQDTPQPQQPQTPSPSPIPPKPQMKNSLVLIMSILLIITVGIAGLFYFQIQKLSKELSKYQTQPSPTPTATPDPTANWETYIDSKNNFSFKYPPDLGISDTVNDFTSLKADREYWVGVSGSDVIYLSLFLYKSNKSASDWWTTEGKNKFEQLAKDVEGAMNPRPSINLTYNTQATTFSSKEALNVVVSSNYESPQTPKQRFLTIVQQNGFVIMTSYQDMGTTQPSIEISNQILSTFKFLEQSDQILGIQINKCCSCPTKINKSSIGTDGWVLYEKGKDYSDLLPATCKAPNIVACAPCPPLEE